MTTTVDLDGARIAPSALEDWRYRMRWSIREACRQLEITQDRWRGMVSGSSRIPAHIWLACAELERRRATT